MKYSILYCVYNNESQFINSLFTAVWQNHSETFEIIVIDNATPDESIKNHCQDLDGVRYSRIANKHKHCTNITQGMNIAANQARGDYIVIVADSNVLLSFNLLEEIDKVIDKETLVLSTGPKNDVKISPGGSKNSEYGRIGPNKAAKINHVLLTEMGWPTDPLRLKLLSGKHRFPPPHLARDCYIAAMPREAFLLYGGYDESKTQWGPYHEYFLDGMASYLKKERHLTGVRIVHQYHRVLKERSI
jgi:glycosyltransferase involved in cell wall biosynthesis